jgi:Flp pilus assembly protein TadD
MRPEFHMRLLVTIIFGALALALSLSPASAQTGAPPLDEALSRPAPPATLLLPLDAARRKELDAALGRRDYTRAETILLDEVNRDPKSPRAAKLLTALGSIFFLDGQYLNAAISFKKAEAISPLDERSRFTLAMSYITLGRRDWARPELEMLAAADPKRPLYLYWLARLDYDAQQYRAAVAKFQRVIALDPSMVKAYDNLGLCYEHLSDFDEAVKSYRRAIDLNRREAKPSPWPHVNLATLLIILDRLAEAEELLREALAYDAGLSQAHYQLGLALEKQARYPEAIKSLKEAAALDPLYPEPHYTLGRIYQRQGDKEGAKRAFETHQRLKQQNRGR